jgi:hypothetical protein
MINRKIEYTKNDLSPENLEVPYSTGMVSLFKRLPVALH